MALLIEIEGDRVFVWRVGESEARGLKKGGPILSLAVRPSSPPDPDDPHGAVEVSSTTWTSRHALDAIVIDKGFSLRTIEVERRRG